MSDRTLKVFVSYAHADEEHKEKLLKQLFDDRNVKMTEHMLQSFKEAPGRSNFFAVGAGHYIGRSNIVDLLTGKGYKVTRIEN